jgi:hypothetical protein
MAALRKGPPCSGSDPEPHPRSLSDLQKELIGSSGFQPAGFWSLSTGSLKLRCAEQLIEMQGKGSAYASLIGHLRR